MASLRDANDDQPSVTQPLVIDGPMEPPAAKPVPAPSEPPGCSEAFAPELQPTGDPEEI